VNALPAPPSVTASTAAPSGAGAGNKPRPVRTRAGLLPSGGARHRCRVDSSDRPSAEAAGARPAIPVSMRDCEACGDGKVTPPASPRGARGPSSEDELYPATSSRTASLRHGAVLGLGIGRVMINAQPRSSCAVRGCGAPRGDRVPGAREVSRFRTGIPKEHSSPVTAGRMSHNSRLSPRPAPVWGIGHVP